MLKSRFQITTAIFALLWFIGVNHCVFEKLYLGSDSSRNECLSHSKEDPASHSEGQPCLSKVISPQTLPEIAAPISYVNLVSNLFANTILPVYIEGSVGNAKEEIRQNYRNALVSLSIASNAPPLSV